MKLLRFNISSEPTTCARLGLLLEDNMVGDLQSAYACNLVQRKGDALGAEIAALRIPNSAVALIAGGPPAWDALLEAAEFLKGCGPDARGLMGEPLVTRLDKCRLHAPVRPGKVIAVGRNYREHLAEFGMTLPHEIPSAWIKAPSTIIGPTRDVMKPACVQELDYETELTIVIGKKCKNVPVDKAYDVICGYIVANDISARDIVRRERKEGNQLLGKMFDTFAPTGPWLVTKDEIPDPMNLKLITRVNGEIRQNGNTSRMVWSVPQLVAYLSQMTLEPGDLILTGTPEGVAAGRKPDQPSWFLKHGDILESEVEKVGVLRNRIVDDPDSDKVSWKW
jgi:acylpyruvate hydrolase